MRMYSLWHHDGDYGAAPHCYEVWCGAAPGKIAPVASRIACAASHPTPYPELRLKRGLALLSECAVQRRTTEVLHTPPKSPPAKGGKLLNLTAYMGQSLGFTVQQGTADKVGFSGKVIFSIH